MTDLALTPAEIYKLTGKKQPAAQLRHLRRMGIKAERSDNPDQPVCVLLAWLPTRSEIGPQSTPRLKSDRRAATAQT